MNKQLRAFLESIGFEAGASSDQAGAFLLSKPDNVVAEAAVLDHKFVAGIPGIELVERESADGGDGDDDAAPRRVEFSRPVSGQMLERESGPSASDERKRIKTIRTMGKQLGVSDDVIEQAIDDELTKEQASYLFSQHITRDRAQAGGQGDAGFYINQGARGDHSQQVAAAGLAFGQMLGHNPIDENLTGKAKEENERLANMSDAYHYGSLLEVCATALKLDGRDVPRDREEMIRAAMAAPSMSAAVSTNTLGSIFTSSVNATVRTAYNEVPDTTAVWCQNREANDFKQHEDIIAKMDGGALKLHARGGSAKHSSMSDEQRTFSINRFAEQFVVDEMDIIDDRLDVFQEAPAEMAAKARRILPDMIYAELMGNDPTFGGTALFHTATHRNYVASSGALSATTLATALSAMMKQYRGTGKNKVNLNLMPKYLIVPPDLYHLALELTKSTNQTAAGTAGTVTRVGNVNPIANHGLVVVSESRIANGVVHPVTGSSETADTDSWYLVAEPTAGTRTCFRLFLRGTNQRPVVRTSVLTQGNWGINFDIKHDVGAYFADFQGFYKSAGA